MVDSYNRNNKNNNKTNNNQNKETNIDIHCEKL